MGMNNVLYRFRHLIEKPSYGDRPARLRMNRLVKPAGSKTDFELFCLAVSAINGCGTCMQAHEKVVLAGGLGEEQVFDAVRHRLDDPRRRGGPRFRRVTAGLEESMVVVEGHVQHPRARRIQAPLADAFVFWVARTRPFDSLSRASPPPLHEGVPSWPRRCSGATKRSLRIQTRFIDADENDG